MTHGSLFSGIGGFDLASQWMGWDNIFHCEWNEFGQRVLKHHFPKSISYGDITTTDFTIHRGQIDILTGGFPCQPYSQAGKRLGKEDDRHLWPEMLRAIREIQPRWVVGENVLGLVNWNGGLVFDEVQADLENEGYVVQPYVLPACAVNAPHRRDRVWFVAHSAGARNGNNGRGRNLCEGNKLFQESKWEKNKQWDKSLSQSGLTTNSNHARTVNTMRYNGNGSENDEGRQVEPQPKSWTACGDVANTTSIGCGGRGKQPKSNQSKKREVCENEQQHGNGVWSETTGCGSFASDPNSIGLSCEGRPTGMGWERLGINDAQDNRGGWENFPTQSPICQRNDGLPTELDGITFSKWRQESVKAYGNAIVPQVAHQIFKAIEQYECQASPNP
jgi:DNA (cytosine-5)-methyltransferase 1